MSNPGASQPADGPPAHWPDPTDCDLVCCAPSAPPPADADPMLGGAEPAAAASRMRGLAGGGAVDAERTAHLELVTAVEFYLRHNGRAFAAHRLAEALAESSRLLERSRTSCEPVTSHTA